MMMRCRSLAASSSARTFRHRCWTPPPRRLASTAAPTPLPSEGALTVACGIAFFVAAERSTGAALSACELNLPSHVTALCVLGGFAAVPSIGVHLQRLLGPATAWLRASLPCTLVPAFLFPVMCELPSGDALPKLAALAAGSAIITCAATGHIAAALVRGVPLAVATPCISSVSAAAAVSSSPLFGFAALTCGSLLSAAIYTWHPAASTAVTRAPAYIGLTVALYVASARCLPPAIRRFAPPNVACAIALLPLLLATGGSAEVRTYLDGAGAALLDAVKPAMVTLGLYAHTHRAVMRSQMAALAGLAFVIAPAILFGVARAGASLNLEPAHVAAILPASTTTGLALTMPAGIPLIRTEWVAAGTAFNSFLVQVTLPLLMGVTMLRTPFSRGVGIGCTGHVGGMAALLAAGESAAADAAAVALVVVGVARSVLVQVPAFSRALTDACGQSDVRSCTGK